MTKSEQTEIHRLLTNLAQGDFYSNTQALTAHPAFKRLQTMAAAPRYPEGNEHHIRSISWQDLLSMMEQAEHQLACYHAEADDMADAFRQVVQRIDQEMQRRLLKLVPEGEAVTGDV